MQRVARLALRNMWADARMFEGLEQRVVEAHGPRITCPTSKATRALRYL